MSDNKLPTSSGWYTARWDGENMWTVTYFDRGHGEVCKATVKGAPEWSPSCAVVEWGECVLPDSAAPDWTAAIEDARRTLTHPTDYSATMRNMAQCILAAHEERERDRISAESLDRADAEAAAERERVQRALDDGARVEYQHWSFGGIYHGATLPARPETAEARPPVRGDDETASPPFILTPDEAKDIRAHYTAQHEAAIRADERARVAGSVTRAGVRDRGVGMIDKTQPPPGWDLRMVKGRWRSERLPGGTISDHRTQADCISTAWRIYAEDSRPAVVGFAERVATWARSEEAMVEYDRAPLVHEDCCDNMRAWIAEQILAAAREERSLP